MIKALKMISFVLPAALILMAANSFNPSEDPCENPGVHKDTVPIAFTSATATALVPLSTTKSIWICSYLVTMTGSTPGIQLGIGQSNACATPTVITGVLTAPMITTGGGMQGEVPYGKALCVTASGGSPSINGVLSYIQQ